MTRALLPRLKRSLIDSAGTVVFGMEDGTVSIFGLIFGVAATTSNTAVVLVAGASGAAAAAVSMMAGAYLDAETSRDKGLASQGKLKSELGLNPAALAALVARRLAERHLSPPRAAALKNAVRDDPEAAKGLVELLQTAPEEALSPAEQAAWMLVADFFSAAVPILPFILLPIATARYVSAGVTILLLAALGVGRAKIGRRSTLRTVAETVAVGVVAALAGVGIGLLMNRGYGGS